MMLIYILVTIVSILLTLIYKKFGRQIHLSSKLPGPPALPIIGNALLFYNKKPYEIFKTMSDLIQKYGTTVRVWIGPQLLITMTDPKDIEVLCSSQKYIEKSVEYKPFKQWLGDGLLLSFGKKWHQRRKIITPAFHFKILEQFVEIFDRQGNIFVEKLTKHKPEEKVELYPYITLYALDVICETAMGTAIDAQLKSNSPYVQAVKKISHVIYKRIFDASVKTDFLFQFSKYNQMQKDALQILHGFTDKVIQERHAELLKTQSSTNNDADIGIRRKMAFLDMLLQSTVDGKPLTDLEIREEVDTFMFEGHDTTTSGITFTLYCILYIAKYTEIQEKCYQEIIEVFGNEPDDQYKSTTLADLSSLQYLEKVIKESMRLYPPVPAVGRQHKEEITINNITYPANCTIWMAIYDMQRNPAFFSNPLKFSPERFDGQENDGEKVHTFAYLPFSAGPRNCIGQKFAMFEMKSILSKVLRNFEISLNTDSLNEPKLLAELILKSENPINFHIKPRAMKDIK